MEVNIFTHGLSNNHLQIRFLPRFLYFVPKCLIGNNPITIHWISWRKTFDKQLSKAMVTYITNTYMRQLASTSCISMVSPDSKLCFDKRLWSFKSNDLGSVCFRIYLVLIQERMVTHSNEKNQSCYSRSCTIWTMKPIPPCTVNGIYKCYMAWANCVSWVSLELCMCKCDDIFLMPRMLLCS